MPGMLQMQVVPDRRVHRLRGRARSCEKKAGRSARLFRDYWTSSPSTFCRATHTSGNRIAERAAARQ
jgi:hypothetical protein